MKIEDLLRKSDKAIDGVLKNNAWQKKVNPLGFTTAELQKGKAMRAELQLLSVAQQKEYGEQYSATDALHQARQAAWKIYKHHLQVARLALADDRGQYKALQLDGTREKGLLKWVKQARTFYANAQLASTKLKAYGIKSEDLAQGASLIEAVYEAYDRRDKEQDEARQSTHARRQKEMQLTRWMRRYVRALNFAFENQPEVLQELGLKVKEETNA
ncbi:hypothetical protein [Tunicatimonas pelagia]|uniref:hypothetical protein n=1 Tax=Tunicatimonas pelagia TaxID=931531 RepID=UPI0026657296|nr:hypothetical protein [Tunicatimonas pelagia]WKN41746.1 hypothetical protein P0M28_22165 [Tunicatimonas pelagia]